VTGAVDRAFPLARIPEVLVKFSRRMATTCQRPRLTARGAVETDNMVRYLDLLRNGAQGLRHLTTDLVINLTGLSGPLDSATLSCREVIPTLVPHM
jgi:hypothetical protein